MCKIGDILLIYNAKNQGKPVGPHQFIVLDDEAGTVRSMDYDIITTIMSSMLTDKKGKLQVEIEQKYNQETLSIV